MTDDVPKKIPPLKAESFRLNDDETSGLAKSIDDFYSEDPLPQTVENGVLIYKDKKYAVGLFWLSYGQQSMFISEKSKAQELSADYYCTRNIAQQIGFGYLKSGHRWGMPSFAALAADALVGEWHGIFEIENQFIYVAVHSDNIAPRGDLLFTSEGDAYDHFMAESEKFKWPKAFTPESWDIANNDGEIAIDQILDNQNLCLLKPATIDGFFRGKSNKNLFLVWGLILLSFLFLLFIFRPFIAEIIPDRAIPPEEQIDINFLLSPPPPEGSRESISRPTISRNFALPNINFTLKNCVESFDSLMMSLPGWNLNTMRCNNNIVEAIWQNDIGTLSQLKEFVSELPEQINTIYGANGQFIANIAISENSELIEKPLFLNRENSLFLLEKNFGGKGILQVQDVSANNSNITSENLSDDNIEININNLQSFNINFLTALSPLSLKDNLKIPGLKLNMIEWNVRQNQWIYNFSVYLLPNNISNDSLYGSQDK